MAIGNCEVCDRKNVPVLFLAARGAHPEVTSCFICRGDTDPDPYGEMQADIPEYEDDAID
jgi:hypothetical protein